MGTVMGPRPKVSHSGRARLFIRYVFPLARLNGHQWFGLNQ